MSTENTGGPAFPVGSGDMRDPTGMTLRDYFAAKAMQGMFANPDLCSRGMFREENFDMAYAAADKMLKARSL